MTTTPIYIINLDDDSSRLKELNNELSHYLGFDAKRISAILGSQLPLLSREILTADGLWARNAGAIGCFLSHINAWEQIKELNYRFAIVLEDDAAIKDLGDFHKLSIPLNADLVFLNDAMALRKKTEMDTSPPKCVPVIEALLAFGSGPTLTQRNVGTYGYAITPNGAVKLLAAIQDDLLYGHIDWRLIRYSVSQIDVVEIFGTNELSQVIHNHHNAARPPKWNVIVSYALEWPLISHKNEFKTRIHNIHY